MNASPAKHLIIAGVTRAGTTSLFNYLADHPGIQRSTIKETRFFLDHDELRRMHCYEEGLDAYATYFPHCPADAVRLEATPDYVFRPVVAQRIAQSLPDVHVVVILREPISRLISWRRYAIQNGLLDPGTTLAEYVDQQFDAERDDLSTEKLPQHLRSLCEGRYARYLGPWVDAFGPSRLTVCNYRDLLDDPAAVTARICDQAGLDHGFYDNYVFEVHNASRRVRWPRVHGAYRSLIWRVKPLVHDKPAVRAAMRGVRRTTDTLLGRAGSAKQQADPGNLLSKADWDRLEAYYAKEPEALARLLGLPGWTW